MLCFVHGWGFDGSIWSRLHDALGEPEAQIVDLGYFGHETPVRELSDEPILAIGHSLGSLHLLRNLPARCAGLVAINGFDRFASAKNDGTAVSQRVVDRMIRRFKELPDQVLIDFRARCGSDERLPLQLRLNLLLEDLELLRDADEREAAEGLAVPVLVLQGGEDKILPPGMRATVFAGARDIERYSLAGQEHLLPVTAPEWCAAHIRSFATRLNVPL